MNRKKRYRSLAIERLLTAFKTALFCPFSVEALVEQKRHFFFSLIIPTFFFFPIFQNLQTRLFCLELMAAMQRQKTPFVTRGNINSSIRTLWVPDNPDCLQTLYVTWLESSRFYHVNPTTAVHLASNISYHSTLHSFAIGSEPQAINFSFPR